MELQALLDEFPGYLEENRLAPARHIPFLTRWFERYLAAPYDAALRPDDRLTGMTKILELRNYSPPTERTYGGVTCSQGQIGASRL